MALKLTPDEFAFLAHDEACPDCLGHEEGVEELKKRFDYPDLMRRVAAEKAANPGKRITMEAL